METETHRHSEQQRQSVYMVYDPINHNLYGETERQRDRKPDIERQTERHRDKNRERER